MSGTYFTRLLHQSGAMVLGTGLAQKGERGFKIISAVPKPLDKNKHLLFAEWAAPIQGLKKNLTDFKISRIFHIRQAFNIFGSGCTQDCSFDLLVG